MIADQLPDVRKADVSGKRVFLRADLDVPLKQFKVQSSKFKVEIEDDARLVAGIPTVKYLLEQKAKVIVGGHLGRPKQAQSAKLKVQSFGAEFSLMPIAQWLLLNFQFEIFNFQFEKLDGFDGWRIAENLFLLENLRFYEGEEKNDADFAKQLATTADLYVNDAFAMCHRSHASVVGVPKFLPHYAGIRLIEEVEHLGPVLENPKRPLVVIIGGKKIETKLPLVEKMISLADKVLVGGLIAKEMQKLVQQDKIEAENLMVAKLDNEGTDITEESLNEFFSIIKNAKTIVWNGPLGRIEAQDARGPVRSSFPASAPLVSPRQGRGTERVRAVGSPPASDTPRSDTPRSDSEHGTKELAKAIVESNAYKVVGGGDTTEFLKRIGVIDKFDFVSTGGGAMLTFLSGQKLPGLAALTL